MGRSNDREAAEAAYPRVYRSLVAMGASPADAADALQDAFERALRKGGSVRGALLQPDAAEPLDGWLFVVALRRWRTQRWRDRVFMPLAFLRTHPEVSPPGEDAVTLIAELGRLPPREREVIVARYVLGLSQRETAEVLGIAVGTVAATTAHATAKLRERLDDLERRPRATTSSDDLERRPRA